MSSCLTSKLKNLLGLNKSEKKRKFSRFINTKKRKFSRFVNTKKRKAMFRRKKRTKRRGRSKRR